MEVHGTAEDDRNALVEWGQRPRHCELLQIAKAAGGQETAFFSIVCPNFTHLRQIDHIDNIDDVDHLDNVDLQ